MKFPLTFEKNNISKQFNNYLRLSENLVNDLINFKESNAYSFVNSSGQTTLRDMQKKINEFINNENFKPLFWEKIKLNFYNTAAISFIVKINIFKKKLTIPTKFKIQ